MKKVIIALILGIISISSFGQVTTKIIYEASKDYNFSMAVAYKNGKIDNIGFCSSDNQMLVVKRNNFKQMYKELVNIKNKINDNKDVLDSLVLSNAVRGFGKINVYKKEYALSGCEWVIGKSKNYPKAIYYANTYDGNGHITFYNFEYYRKENGHIIHTDINYFLHSRHPERFDVIGTDIVERCIFNMQSYAMVKIPVTILDEVINIFYEYAF